MSSQLFQLRTLVFGVPHLLPVIYFIYLFEYISTCFRRFLTESCSFKYFSRPLLFEALSSKIASTSVRTVTLAIYHASPRMVGLLILKAK